MIMGKLTPIYGVQRTMNGQIFYEKEQSGKRAAVLDLENGQIFYEKEQSGKRAAVLDLETNDKATGIQTVSY